MKFAGYPKEPYSNGEHDWRNRDNPINSLPEDDGTMQANVDELAGHVVGHKIVRAGMETVPHSWRSGKTVYAFVLALDDGTRVALRNTDDCCAHTDLASFLVNVEQIDHIITGVGTTDEFETWHIFADFGDVIQLKVAWSPGNPFYYGYGFAIEVLPL